MIGLLYVLKSTLVMGVLLLFYRGFLENEKMHRFNRVYLLAAIVLSLIVPFLPTGLIFTTELQPLVDATPTHNIVLLEGAEELQQENWISTNVIFAFIYLSALFLFFLKFSKNLLVMFGNVRGNETRRYKGAQIVLLENKVSPYTFLNYIFLHKADYESENVDQKLLDHELTHARQGHSWDILFIELVMLIFWFNPILRWYKTAIQLNHEFLADDSVIEQHKTVKSYQYLLLDTIANKNNKIYLASNINFHLTQKRLKMMTKTSSSLRKKLLIFSTIPIVLALLICCGSPVLGQKQNTKDVEVIDNQANPFKDFYFGKAIVHYKTNDGMTKVISYKSLNEDIKAKIPPPPPPPPVLPGSKQSEQEIEPLPNGTIVYLSENGSVRIGGKNMGSMGIPPPPPPRALKNAGKVKPPAPPVPPKPAKAAKAPKPPKPPKAPKSESMLDLIHDFTAPDVPNVPPPPPPISFDDLIDDTNTFYIDDKKVSAKEAQKVWEMDRDNIATVDVKNGKGDRKTVYIKMK